MTATCRLVAARLPDIGVDRALGRSLDVHVAECLTCQAEVSRYRRMSRLLGGLAEVVESAPLDLASRVDRALDHEAVSDGQRRVRVAAATGAIAATAAGVVAVALWRRGHAA